MTSSPSANDIDNSDIPEKPVVPEYQHGPAGTAQAPSPGQQRLPACGCLYARLHPVRLTLP